MTKRKEKEMEREMIEKQREIELAYVFEIEELRHRLAGMSPWNLLDP